MQCMFIIIIIIIIIVINDSSSSGDTGSSSILSFACIRFSVSKFVCTVNGGIKK